jgi:hypothetical protein
VAACSARFAALGQYCGRLERLGRPLRHLRRRRWGMSDAHARWLRPPWPLPRFACCQAPEPLEPGL